MDSSPPPRRRRSRDRRKYKRGRRSRHRRSLSSSSSASSSSSDVYKDDDESDGGMRTSSPWRSSKSSRKGGRSRADITPVEVDHSVTWDSVGGLESHIEALKEMVMLPLLYPEFYKKYNVSPPSGVLFYGPPGTGKTLLARALANSCSFYGEGDQPSGFKEAATSSLSEKKKKEQERPRRHVTFYMRKGADCLSKWVGEAERQLRLLFEEAKRNQPSIIFFDEIDGLAPVRSAKQDQIHASIVSTLLALMDGMDSRGRVVVIGATNRLDAIDPALRRPGRFDRELGFKLPSVNERKSMLAIHTKHWNPPLSDGFRSELAEQTVGYCGADIKALCAEAALCSLRRVYPQVYASHDKLLINLDKVVVARGDFVKAAKKITPASHRAVSSFALPLPRAVKGLLQSQLTKVLRDVARHFPLFPLDKAAIDDAITTESEEGAGVLEDGEEDEDVDIYAVANHKDCDVCHGEEGELLCCGACPGAFHHACLSEMATSSADGLWFCLDCRNSNSAAVQRALQRGRKKLVHSMASLHLPRHSGFPRVLIAGKAGMGQQYIGPALLHSLEGLTHFSLDYPSLVADSNSHFPEEALIQRLSEAQKCLPCVIYLPHAELWWKNTSESMHLTLKMMLMNLQVRANLPILFLACTASSSDEQTLPGGLVALFKEDPSVSLTSVVVELDAPSREARLAHFDQVFCSFATAPAVQKSRRSKREKLAVLPLAPLPPVVSKMELSPEEQEKRRERDLHFLRELRIFLSQVLHYCYSQRLYTPFYVPVDPVAVPNYYLIVKRPMDLSTMRDKLNDEEYTCFEQFMDDIQLIVRNANVFNPKRSRTRHIAHAAGTMKDNILSYAYRFRIRQGYDLFAKCRDVTKRLRAHPEMYGEYGQRFLKTGKNQRKKHLRALEKPSVRISARLRGVKAPDVSMDAAISHGTESSSKAVSNGVKEEPATEVQRGEVKSKGEMPKLQSAQQWFDEEEEGGQEENKSDEEGSTEDKADNKTNKDTDEEAEEVYEEGDRIFVSSRTHPGINREGGAAVVQSRNKDGTYNVKYILGGSEKSVSCKYVGRLTDDAVMESVKTQRSVANDSDGVGTVRLIQDEEKMDETDYFDELLWPLLKEEGWRRDDNFDIIEASGKESGLAVQRVVFTPAKKRHGESVTLNSVVEALQYIDEDPELSLKLFGQRFAERMMTEEVLGEGESSDDEAVEEEQETPEFIYEEARMTAVLTELVDKTTNCWRTRSATVLTAWS
ncbi:ATPase [Phytophthora infestans T30-4]|uniref:ATPase n=1 Tax=Phytophthora infestans (strain T30-4) TaxID=403677 RepID=D0P2N4_PHYIT|nr:ATPase [Phytophthora infestans T30-4]EEY56694.1 ATPase [Phytophthora infestans T30-4]|eukprot:XP_002895437.1 ATPase [Phytophthora infestans T30-4]